MDYVNFCLTEDQGLAEIKSNGNWYGIIPYSKEETEESKKRWFRIKCSREEFVFDLVQEALYIGMIYHKNEAPAIREYLNKADDNLLYATADFINELIYK